MGEILLTFIIFVLSIYFIVLEFIEFKEVGRNYFYSVWNYTDIIPPMIHIFVIIMQLFGNLVNFE